MWKIIIVGPQILKTPNNLFGGNASPLKNATDVS